MSNFELLGDDATLTEMGGIFGSYAAQTENLEIETKHYEDKMRELRAKNQIKLNIDMAMNKVNKLEESEFLASEEYNRKSGRDSKQNTDRSETLALMKKEMEQAKKIIEKFHHTTNKDLAKNRRDSARNKRPSSKLSVKKSQLQKQKEKDQREDNSHRESQFSTHSQRSKGSRDSVQNRLTTSHIAKMKDGKPHQFLRRSSSSLTRLLKVGGQNRQVNNFLGSSSALRKSGSRQMSEGRSSLSRSGAKLTSTKPKKYNQKIISKSSIPNQIHNP